MVNCDNKQQIYCLEQQIKKFEERKGFLISQMVGACEELNYQIRECRREIKMLKGESNERI